MDSSDIWMKANAGQTGLYRVNYDLVGWVHFISQLQSDHTVSFRIVHSVTVPYVSENVTLTDISNYKCFKLMYVQE